MIVGGSMKNIPIRDLESERLYIKVPTMDEQYDLWKILTDVKVNRYYFPTPDRIFNKYGLSKDTIDDLKKAREIFLSEFGDWDRQKPFYEKKIEAIRNGDADKKFTWSIFLKNGEVIGQITIQPNRDHPEIPGIRDMGWFINPKYQGNGYCTEAASKILDFMFNEVEIDKIDTSTGVVNVPSWSVLEKLGFKRYGEYDFTYYDEGNTILRMYKYVCDRDSFNSGR